MKNHTTTNGITLMLFASFLLFASINLTAQYKLELKWQKEPGGAGLYIPAIAKSDNDSLLYFPSWNSIYTINTLDGSVVKIDTTDYTYGRFIMSKDGKNIVAATGNAGENGIGLLEPITFKRTLWVNYPNFTDITYNDKQNKFVANYSPDIRVYDVASQKLDKEYNTGLALNQANLTDDGKYLIYSYRTYSTKPDKTHYFIKILDLEGKLIKEVKELSSGKFTLTNDDKTLIYFDSTAIHFFDLETMKEKEEIPLGGLDPAGIEMSNDGKFMLLGGTKGSSGLQYCDLVNKSHFLIFPNGTWRNFKLNKDNSSLFWALSDLLYRFDIAPNTSILEIENKLEFSIQVKDNNLILKSDKEINPNWKFSIIGVDGKIQKQINSNEVQYNSNSISIEISALITGTYILQVIDKNNKLASLKFIKSN